MARPRRRHGRGGAPFTGEPNGLQPGDDIGNRRSFKQTQLPPDNIGNRKDLEEDTWVPNDDVGNRIEAAPTHDISGALASIDGRRRRKKGGQSHQRVGRYIVGGVNPVVAGNVQRAVEALKEADERKHLERMAQRAAAAEAGEHSGEGAPLDEEGRRGRRRRRRRRDGREQVDGQAAQEVSERRAQRFFDFEEDDRFEYVLKSDPEQKRKDAHEAVQNVLSGAGRDAVVKSRVLDDENRPKVIVTIEEKGPAASLGEERRGQGAEEPLFVLGNAALMSLNYLVNKIVNRFPDDRIRLAILPAADEKLYLDSLAAHRRLKRAEAEGAKAEAEAKAPTNGAAGPAAPVVAASAEEPPAAEAPAEKPAAKARAKKAAAKAPAKEAPAAEPAAAEEPAISAEAEAEEAEKPATEAKPKRVGSTTKKAVAKTTTAKKAAAKETATEEEPAAEDEAPAPEGASDADAAGEGDAEEAAKASGAQKATKKRASAKVSSRSRASADREEAPVAKKASATKATAKKATAKKKSAPRKKASSEE